jgi:poly(A) polymerase
MRIGEYSGRWTDAAVKRLMRDAGMDMADLVTLAEADRMGANPDASTANLRELEQRMESILLKLPIAELRSPLNGSEIMELLHIPPGTKVKEVKSFLIEEILEGRLDLKDKETARKMVLDRFRDEKAGDG